MLTVLMISSVEADIRNGSSPRRYHGNTTGAHKRDAAIGQANWSGTTQALGFLARSQSLIRLSTASREQLRRRHLSECRKLGTIKAETLHISSERADRNAAVIKKWHVQEYAPRLPPAPRRECEPASSRGARVPIGRNFTAMASPSAMGRSRRYSAHQSSRGHDQGAPTMSTRPLPATSTANNGFQANARTRRALLNARHRATRNRELANHKCYFHLRQRWIRESRLRRRKKLCSGPDMLG